MRFPARINRWLRGTEAVERRWILLFLILCLFAVLMDVAHAATRTVRMDLVKRQTNGRFDAEFPTGVDSSPLTWVGIPAIQITRDVTDACNLNLRTLGGLAGTNALTATLAKESGTLPAGCTASTNGLTGTPTATTAPTLLQWRATDGGTPVLSNYFTLEVVAPAGTDSVGPVQVTGLAAAGGTGNVSLSWDQTSDPYGSGAASGVASYEVLLDGAVVATVAAPSPHQQGQFTAYAVGGANGTQSATRSGANLTMSSGGTGLGASSAQYYGTGVTVTGDVVATLKFTGFSGAVTTSTAGWAVVADPADAQGDAVYGTCRVRDSDDKVNNRYLVTSPGTAANGAFTAAQSTPLWLRLLITPSGVQCLTSSNGNDFTATEAARALSLGTAPYILAFHASGTSGTTTTAALEQVSIVPTTARMSYVHTTNVGGSYQIRAKDSAGNYATASTAVSATPTSVVETCTGDPAPQLVLDDNFDSSPAGTVAWVSGTSYARGTVRKSPANSLDYYCRDTCSGATDPSASSQWAAATNDAVWNAANCRGWDSYSPSQDTCPAPSTTRARSGARSLRVQLTFHQGGSSIPSLWVSGTTYSVGDEVASTDNFKRYIRKTNGAGTTDPKNDATNWERTDWYHKGDYGPTADVAHRTELTMLAPSGGLHIGDDIWYGFSVYLPSGLDLSAFQSYLFPWQLHDAPDPGEISRNPPLWLSLFGSATPQPANLASVDPVTAGVDPTEWRLGGWWDADAIQTTRTYDGNYSAGSALGAWKPNDTAKWTDFVIHYRPHYLANQGITEVWKDGVKIDMNGAAAGEAYFGANSPNDQSAPYLKMGIYTRNWAPSELVPRDWPKSVEYYIDAVKVALAPATPYASSDTTSCAYRAVAPSGTIH